MPPPSAGMSRHHHKSTDMGAGHTPPVQTEPTGMAYFSTRNHLQAGTAAHRTVMSLQNFPVMGNATRMKSLAMVTHNRTMVMVVRQSYTKKRHACYAT